MLPFYHIVWFVLTWNNDDPQRRNTLIKTSQISVLTFFRSLCDMCSPSTPWICWHSISLPFPDFLFLTSRNCHQLTFYYCILCGILFEINSGKNSFCLIFCPALFLAFYLGFCLAFYLAYILAYRMAMVIYEGLLKAFMLYFMW